MQIPVLLIIFNRPDTVRRVMEALAVAQPKRLYILADGPRSHMRSDSQLCNEARRVAQDVSWPCTIETLFLDNNMGVDPAVERGITWFFEHEEEGIILEDDCIPHADFFAFAAEMLNRYRDDTRILMVSGNNFLQSTQSGAENYYFSRYPTTWGWATWRRAWNAYDTTLSSYPAFLKSKDIQSVFAHTDEQRHWLRYFSSLYHGTRSAWDAKWLYSIWSHNGFGIVPTSNLVSNIGFGTDATHTKTENRLMRPLEGLPAPYQGPVEVVSNAARDRRVYEYIYRVTLWDKVRYIFAIVYEKVHTGIHPSTH